MTKGITSTAALQLVERGTLKLDEPVAKHLPELADLQVLEGFDKVTGKPILHPASKPVTLRRMLTHTAGFAYDTWDQDLLKYVTETGKSGPLLMTEPGTRWEYGTNLDWTGRLVEKVSGKTLEDYFQQNILRPLGMKDTGFILRANQFDRMVSSYQRQSDGSLKESSRTPPPPPKSFNGGGGLHSTAADYVRFMQMILRHGRGSGKEQILRPETVRMMTANQVGELSAGKMTSCRPDRSSDVDFHPGVHDGFSFGFLINGTAYEGGRRPEASLGRASRTRSIGSIRSAASARFC
jgi:methyl acetate hydrolase